jgi:hypothetical protein
VGADEARFREGVGYWTEPFASNAPRRAVSGRASAALTIGGRLSWRPYYFRADARASSTPPPWSVEKQDACFVVRDANGQALSYVYFEDEPGQALSRQAADPRRDAADRGQYRQAAGALAEARLGIIEPCQPSPAYSSFSGMRGGVTIVGAMSYTCNRPLP